MKRLSILAILFVSILFFSCNENRIYNEHQDVTGTPLTLKKDEVHTFKPTVEDNTIPYNVIVALRHHSQIGLNAIQVNLEMTTPSGTTTKTAYTLPIRDANGELLGAAAGDFCDTETIILKDFTFPETGNYTIKVSPITDKDISPVMEVGMIVDKIVAEK